MNIRKINFLELKEMSSRLSNLLNQSRQNNIFLTPEWLITWWEFWGHENELYFLVAEDDEKLIGFAPLKLCTQSWLKLSKVRILSFINSHVAADHMDWVSCPSHESAVFNAFFDYLYEHRSEWDILSLQDLPPASHCLELYKRLPSSQFYIYQQAGQRCPYLPLEGDWETYLSQKSKNFRQQTRAKRRKVENKLKARLIYPDSAEQIQVVLQRLAELNPERWNQKGESSSFSHANFQNFHLQIAQTFANKGWLDLAYLEHDDKIIAVIYNYQYQQKIYYYNTAFDAQYSSHSVGRVLMGYSIEKAFNEAILEFDFLRGVHQYKYEWSNLERQNQDLLIVHKSLNALLWCTRNQLSTKIKELLKKYLPARLKSSIKSFMLKT